MVRYLGLLSVLLFPGILRSQPSVADFTIPKPPGPHCPVTAGQLRQVKSYRADQPIVGTHFFYWYDSELKAHFVDHDGTDALTDHPVRGTGYSYKSSAWWKRELLDVMAAEINFILPVYWGCPGAYDSWSFAGLPPLVQAWEELVREGKKPPRVGLFYDTSTLRHNPRGWHIDLSTDAGKEWFYTTIRDFFSLVPPKMWAAIEGRPIVVLYSPGFALKQDAALFPFLRAQFQRDFATDMYLAKNVGWQGAADSLCSWGGALGLKAYGIAALGPGYDHSAVPGRKALIVDREGGGFYERQWQQLLAYRLQRRAKVVLVETWNELHEGTDVCDSKEFGRQYIDLTAKYARLFRDEVVLPKTGPFAGASQVEWNAERSDEKLGMTMKNSGDGLAEPVVVGGRKCCRSKQSEHDGKYLYLDLDDGFLFDEEDAALWVVIEYYDDGFGSFALEYDSIDRRASVIEGAFKSLAQPVACTDSDKWKTALLKINGGRFANRCNGGDFRLVPTGGDLTLGRVTAKRKEAASKDGRLPAARSGADEVPMVQLIGAPERIGKIWGETNKAAIVHDLDLYLQKAEANGISTEILIERSRKFATIATKIAPHWLAEAGAIARAAGASEDLYVSFVANVYRDLFLHECTSYAVPSDQTKDSGIFFHKNRDNVKKDQAAFVMQSSVPGVNKFIAVSDASVLACMMMVNDKGLAGSADYPGGLQPESAAQHHRGIMNTLMLRYIAERAASCEEALQIIQDFVGKGYYAGGKVNGTHWLFVDRTGMIMEVGNNARHVVSRIHTDSVYFSRLEDSPAAARLRRAPRPVDFMLFHEVSRDPSICLASSIAGMSVEIDPDHPELFTCAWISLPARSVAFPLLMAQIGTPALLVNGQAYKLGTIVQNQRTQWKAVERGMHLSKESFKAKVGANSASNSAAATAASADQWSQQQSKRVHALLQAYPQLGSRDHHSEDATGHRQGP